MQPPTTQPKSAQIRLLETATNYLQPIYIPLPESRPIGQNQSVGSPVQQAGIKVSRRKLTYDAEWLGIVEQRIKASIPAEGYDVGGDTSYLEPRVGRAAIEFFKRTSTALPGEPYIYSSQAGDLVAEFSSPRGRMTCLISSSRVAVFASTKDAIVQKQFLPDQQNSDTFRMEIQEISKILDAGPNGTVDSKA